MVTIVVVALAAGAGTATWVRSVQTARAAEQAQAEADTQAAQDPAQAAEELRSAREAREREAEAARLAEQREREAAEQEAAEREKAEQAAEEEARRAAEEAAETEAPAVADPAPAQPEPADPAPRLGGPPSTGAGPDCGGPESYEPPNGGEYTFYTSTPGTTGDGDNGQIPRSQMVALSWCVDSQGNRQWFLPDAAAALTALNAEFREVFGENIAIDMSYRSLETQQEMRAAYGSVAAVPGESNHGWGTAFDTWEWEAYSFGSARYEWLVANAPAHGWTAPTWARVNGSNPEYWHFEYTG